MGYYSQKLAGERLRRCYEIAPPRVQRYLRAEVDRVLSMVCAGDSILELGCGYGRVLLDMAGAAGRCVGIDTATESLDLARSLAGERGLGCEFLEMDATDMRFTDGEFDLVFCVQNGVCAFGVDPVALLNEAIRVAADGGRVVFSSYSDGFWEHRLEWFELQAEHGLLGEIDRERTGGGVIVCKDGFRAGAMNEAAFTELCTKIGRECSIAEVDGSSVFCELVK